ncbi:MAG: hypothetical protein WC367_10015, partial [Methanoregula sp.]
MVPEPDVLAVRALIRKAELLQHVGRGMVFLIAFRIDPVEGTLRKDPGFFVCTRYFMDLPSG